MRVRLQAPTTVSRVSVTALTTPPVAPASVSIPTPAPVASLKVFAFLFLSIYAILSDIYYSKSLTFSMIVVVLFELVLD